MDSDLHKPLFYNTIKWVIMFSIVVSIIWLVFSYCYADTYAKHKEERKQIEAQQKFRTKFRVEKNRDPMAVLEPKVSDSPRFRSLNPC